MRIDTQDTEQFGSFLEDVWQNTEIGRQYLAGYFSESSFEEHFDLIIDAAVRLANGNRFVTEDNIAQGLSLLITSKRIKPKKAAVVTPLEEVIDDRPVDRLGRKMSPKAQQWQQFEIWCNDPKTSTKEIQARRSDREFNEFYEHFRNAEMAPDPRGMYKPLSMPDAVTAERQSSGSLAAISQDLKLFADAYNKAPVASLRAANGVVTLDGRQYAVAAFNALVDEASRARLIF